LPTNTTYEVPSFNQIYELLLCQAQKIFGAYKPDEVVGIARGGLIPARILVDLLETPQLSILQVEFYTNISQTHPKPLLKHPLTASVAHKKVLLVDDIADTGQSLQFAKTYLQTQGAREIKTATLYKKPHSTLTPDFYEKQTCSWVVFPWDVKETLRKIIQRPDGKGALDLEVAKLVKAGLPKKLTEQLLKDMT
jgi:hypoxanthine phosphoribosyltransferase